MGTELEVADCDFKLRVTRDAYVTREGTSWQGDMGTRGTLLRGHAGKGTRGQGEIQGGKKLPRQGGKIQIQKFRVGWDRREFKSVNYNYLNPL